MDESTTTNKWLVMTAVLTAVFLATVDASIVNVSLATLQRELDTSFALVQWVVLAYLLTLISLVLIFGRLGDIVGKRKLYLSGFVLFTIASTLCGLAPSIGWLIGFRALQALGGSMLQALGFAILTEAFPKEERGKALGIAGTTVSLGIAVGPSLGGLLIGIFSWRAIFLVNLPVGIVGTYLAWRHVPNIVPVGKQRFDFVGAFLLTVTLLAFSLGMTAGQEIGFDDLRSIGLLIGALVGLIAFIAVEQRVPFPTINLSLFRNALFSINLYAGASVFIIVAGTFLYPFYLEYVLEYEIEQIGLMMASFPIMLGVLSPLAGTLSDRLGTRPIAITGLIIGVIACLGISTLDQNTTAFGFIIRLVVLGGAIGVFQSPNNSAVMGTVPRAQLGIASGLLATSRNIGQIIGVPLLGTVFAIRTYALAGTSGDIEDLPVEAIVGGMQAVFLFAAAVLALAVLVYLWSIYLERKQA